jgi:hypothetical protein
LGQLSALRSLDLHGNNWLKALPAEVGALAEMANLNLSAAKSWRSCRTASRASRR